MTHDSDEIGDKADKAGFVMFRNKNGVVFKFFVMSKEDFTELKPQREDFKTAAMLAAQLEKERKSRLHFSMTG